MKKIEFTQIALSIGSGIFLVALRTTEFVLDQVLEISQASEEIFRGDRLPILTPISTNKEHK